jgi:Fur family ferric uptake transcriptional regulator
MKNSKPSASELRQQVMAQAAAAAALQDRRERITAAKLRVTPNRLAVLALIDAAQMALSHADIEAALPTPIDAVTLYRTLESFVEVGLLSKAIGPDRVSRFAMLQGAAANHHEHAHFHCDSCGRVYCLPAKAPRQPQVPEGFAVVAVDLSVHGNCADCQSAA